MTGAELMYERDTIDEDKIRTKFRAVKLYNKKQLLKIARWAFQYGKNDGTQSSFEDALKEKLK